MKEKTRTFSTRWSKDDKWHLSEIGINAILVIVTFFLGFVCQYFVAAETSEGYFSLSNANAIISVSKDLNTVNRTLAIATADSSYIKELLNGPRPIQESSSCKDTITHPYIQLLYSLSDSISKIVPMIETSSYIIKIPMAQDKRFAKQQEVMEKSITTMKEFRVMNSLRKEKLYSKQEMKLFSVSKYSYPIPDNEADTLFNKYKNWKDNRFVTIDIDSGSVAKLRRGEMKWAEYVYNEVMPSLKIISDCYRNFANFKYTNKDSILRINHYSIILLFIIIMVAIIMIFAVVSFKFPLKKSEKDLLTEKKN